MNRKFFQRNKFTLFIIVFFAILLVLLYFSKNILFPKETGGVYGGRLDGIVELNDSSFEKLKTTYSEKEQVKKLDTDVRGRIINIIMTVDDAVSIGDAEKLGNETLECFDEKVLDDYDFQVMIRKDSESENDFPIIGYRSKFNKALSYTKHREKKVASEEE